MQALTERERRTYGLEKVRAVAAGILETAQTTFLLLIAQRWFHAGPAEKGLLQGASSAGLLLTPVLVTAASVLGWNAGRAAAWLFATGGLGLVAACLIPDLSVYVAGAGTGFLCVAAATPFFAAIYNTNYRSERRGDLFSRNIIVRNLAGIGFAWVAGLWLERHPEDYRLLLAVFAGALALSAWCVSRTPAVPLAQDAGRNPLRAFRWVKSDRVFRLTLVSWMFLGFGNLVMSPLRVEYLANERYGLRLNPADIALFTSVVPNIARLLCTRLWGRLFDRMNFFSMRILLNFGFTFSILSFFTGGGKAGLWAGAVLFGISNAGADLAWSLWVTKIAPAHRVTDYMAVHTFLTGCRGLVAPVLAFYCALHFGVGPTAAACTALILIASALLLSEARRRPHHRPAAGSIP